MFSKKCNNIFKNVLLIPILHFSLPVCLLKVYTDIAWLQAKILEASHLQVLLSMLTSVPGLLERELTLLLSDALSEHRLQGSLLILKVSMNKHLEIPVKQVLKSPSPECSSESVESGETSESAFLTSSQALPVPLVYRSYSEVQRYGASM